MIATLNTKQQQLSNGYFESGTGPEKLLLMGSCRVNPYINYLVRFNAGVNRFTIRTIDPFDWHWNRIGDWTDFEKQIDLQEKNSRLLSALAETTIFIHEWFENYGMFNTDIAALKNIYQFGLTPQLDICIPNFNDVHMLGQPLETGLANLEKFYSICRLTSFPEMEQHFRDHWQATRFFWTANHVSKHFTLFIFKQMNDRFLHLPLDDDFWRGAELEDGFAEPHTKATAEDIENYQLKW